MPERIPQMMNEIDQLKSENSLLRAEQVRMQRVLDWRIGGLYVLGFISLLVNIWKATAAQPMLPAPAQTQSVKVGEVSKVDQQRDYLTVQQVAEKEGLEDRTVVSYIAAGRIHPAPVKSARAWLIAANYRILPQSADKLQVKN